MTTYVLDARTVTPHFPGIGRYVANLAPGVGCTTGPQANGCWCCMHPRQSDRLASLAGPQVRLLSTTFTLRHGAATAASPPAARGRRRSIFITAPII